MSKTLVLLAVIVVFTLGGDAPRTDESDDPELLRTRTGDAWADALSSTSTYFSVRRDFRQCSFPLCGGYFVGRVNRMLTTCHDGRRARECYVVDADFENALGLDADEAAHFRSVVDQGRALLRGSIKRATYVGNRVLGRFVPTEGYAAATAAAPVGTFYRVSGFPCFRPPCPPVHRARLNSTLSGDIYGLDLAGVGAAEDKIHAAITALPKRDLLVAGITRNRVLAASQFYLRVRHVS